MEPTIWTAWAFYTKAETQKHAFWHKNLDKEHKNQYKDSFFGLSDIYAQFSAKQN